MRSTSNVYYLFFSRIKSEEVIAQLKRDVIVIFLTIDPYIGCQFGCFHFYIITLEGIAEVRHQIWPIFHWGKEVSVATNIVVHSLQISFYKSSFEIVVILTLYKFMDQHSLKWFHCLLNGMFDLSCFSCKGQYFKDTMTVESFVVVVDDICHVVSTWSLMNCMNNERIVDLSDSIMRSLIGSVVINWWTRRNRPNIIQLPIKTAHILRFIQPQICYGCFHCIRLHNLRIVWKASQVCGRSSIVMSIAWKQNLS